MDVVHSQGRETSTLAQNIQARGRFRIICGGHLYVWSLLLSLDQVQCTAEFYCVVCR
jgi:hypothetical protein